MIAYGKRTPEGRSAAIGKREKKEEALKGLRKAGFHMPQSPANILIHIALARSSAEGFLSR